MLLTRPPLSDTLLHPHVRLACVKHAASVHPEPGSNSPLYGSLTRTANSKESFLPLTLLSYHSLIVNVRCRCPAHEATVYHTRRLLSNSFTVFSAPFLVGDSGWRLTTLPFAGPTKTLDRRQMTRFGRGHK